MYKNPAKISNVRVSPGRFAHHSVHRNAHLLVAITVFMIMMAAAFLMPDNTYAAGKIRGTDVSAPSSGMEFVLFEGEYNYMPKGKVLAELNRIRKNACDKGEPDPRDPSRKLTPADYVPVKWSYDLEWIAQIRAAENALYSEHTRPNGKSCFSVTHNGISSDTEVLAGGMTSDQLITDCISTWCIERYWWINRYDNVVTGHYTALIDPDTTYIAVGAFTPTGSIYGYGAGAFSSEPGLNEAQTGLKGTYLQTIEVSPSYLSVKGTQSVQVDKGKTKKVYLKAKTKYTYDGGDKSDPDFYYENNVYLTNTSDWHTKNKKIAKTDAAGNMRGIKQGKTTAYATYHGREYPVTVKVVDRKKVTPAKVKIKSVKKGKYKIIVKWNRVSKKTKGYQIRVADGKGKVLAYFNVKKSSKKVISDTIYSVPKGTYKISVRAYNKVYGDKYYGKWSKVKKVKVK